MATEVKFIFIYFQNTPKVMPPFFTLAGHPQTTNEQNKFALMVVEACEMAAMKDGNSVLLDKPTDGIACEVKFNKTLNISYIYGGCSSPRKENNSKPPTGENVVPHK